MIDMSKKKADDKPMVQRDLTELIESIKSGKEPLAPWERKHHIVEWTDAEQQKKLLEVVKDGDTITFTNMSGNENPDAHANVTIVWMDEWDRPQKRQPNVQMIVFDTDKINEEKR